MDQLTRNVEEARQQREQLLRHHAATNTRTRGPADVNQGPGDAQPLKGGARWPGSRRSNTVIALGLLLLMTTGLLAGWALLTSKPAITPSFNSAPTRLGNNSADDSRTQSALESQISALVERVETLSGSVVELESKLERVHALTNSIVVSGEMMNLESESTQLPLEGQIIAAVEDNSPDIPPGTTTIKGAEKQGRSLSVPAAASQLAAVADDLTAEPLVAAAEFESKPAAAELAAVASDDTPDGSYASPELETRSEIMQVPQAPEPLVMPDIPEPPVMPAIPEISTEDQPVAGEGAITIDPPGAWVVNLLSSPKKADADRFESRLQGQGIQTEQQQVSVKGTTYWRVQITGFSTSAEAAASADSVGEELGLKDAWIMKR